MVQNDEQFTLDCRLHGAGVLRTSHSTANDVAEFDVLEFRLVETLGLMVELLVEIGEELLG